MSTTTRVSGRKDIRAEAKVLMRLGFEFRGLSGSTHPTFTHPDHPEYGVITLPDTPKPGGYWHKQHRQSLAKAMGMNAAELQARIDGQNAPGSGTGRKRSRNRRGTQHLFVAPETIAAPPVAAPAPRFEPTDPITDGRRALWAARDAERVRGNLANRFPWRSAA